MNSRLLMLFAVQAFVTAPHRLWAQPTGTAMDCAGQLAAGEAAFKGNEFARAEAIYSSALERCDKVLPAADRVLALANLAFSQMGLGKRGEEADVLRRA